MVDAIPRKSWRLLLMGLGLSLTLNPAVWSAPPITALAVTPDGKHAVLGSQAGLELRSLSDLRTVRGLDSELDHIHDLKFSPDGQRLLVAGGSPAEIGIVECREWPTGRLVHRFTGHSDVVYCVAWSPDGSLVATAGGDAVCQVFSAAGGDPVVRYQGHSRAVLAIAFLLDGNSIASTGIDQTIRIWEARTGAHVRTLDNHVGSVNGLAVRPAADRSAPTVLASVSEDRTVRLWQPSIGRLMRFVRLPVVPQVVVWTPSGDQLLVGCNDGRVRTLDPDAAAVVEEREGIPGRVHDLSWDVAGKQLWVAGEQGVVRRLP